MKKLLSILILISLLALMLIPTITLTVKAEQYNEITAGSPTGPQFAGIQFSPNGDKAVRIYRPIGSGNWFVQVYDPWIDVSIDVLELPYTGWYFDIAFFDTDQAVVVGSSVKAYIIDTTLNTATNFPALDYARYVEYDEYNNNIAFIYHPSLTGHIGYIDLDDFTRNVFYVATNEYFDIEWIPPRDAYWYSGFGSIREWSPTTGGLNINADWVHTTEEIEFNENTDPDHVILGSSIGVQFINVAIPYPFGQTYVHGTPNSIYHLDTNRNGDIFFSHSSTIYPGNDIIWVSEWNVAGSMTLDHVREVHHGSGFVPWGWLWGNPFDLWDTGHYKNDEILGISAYNYGEWDYEFPEITIYTAPLTKFPSGTVYINLDAISPDPLTHPIVRVECRIDSIKDPTPLVYNTPPFTDIYFPVPGLTEGVHGLYFTAFDSRGFNDTTDPTYPLYIEIDDAPVIQITYPLDLEIPENSIIGGTSTHDTQLVECRLNEETTWRPANWDPFTDTWDFVLPTGYTGATTVWARAYDGDEYSVEVFRSYNVIPANVPPWIVFDTPTIDEVDEGGRLGGYTSSDAVDVYINTDFEGWEPAILEGNDWYYDLPEGLTGVHEFRVRAFDGALYSPEVIRNINVVPEDGENGDEDEDEDQVPDSGGPTIPPAADEGILEGGLIYLQAIVLFLTLIAIILGLAASSRKRKEKE